MNSFTVLYSFNFSLVEKDCETKQGNTGDWLQRLTNYEIKEVKNIVNTWKWGKIWYKLKHDVNP